MPRSRSAGRASARPTFSRPTATPTSQQTRPATTYAPNAVVPPAQQYTPASTSQGHGLFGQMASTAAGVAVGSSIGHAVGSLFTGGSSAAPEQVNSAPVQQQAQNNCGPALQNFTKCMDDQNGNMQICNWYLEQLKACQAAAAPY